MGVDIAAAPVEAVGTLLCDIHCYVPTSLLEACDRGLDEKMRHRNVGATGEKERGHDDLVCIALDGVLGDPRGQLIRWHVPISREAPQHALPCVEQPLPASSSQSLQPHRGLFSRVWRLFSQGLMKGQCKGSRKENLP